MLNPLIIPYNSWTAFTPEIPKLYWDVKSQEQRIKMLCCEIDKLIKYSDYVASTVNDELTGVDDKLNEAIKELTKIVEDEIEELKSWVKQLEFGHLDWDVQIGEYTNTVDTQRDMFNDVTVHGIRTKDLGELDLTVAELANSGLSVRGLAVYGSKLTNPNIIIEDETLPH